MTGCPLLVGCSVTKLCPTLATPWTVACHAPLSMEVSRQEYWSGLPIRSPGDLPNPGIKLWSPELQADSLLSEPPGKSPLSLQLTFLKAVYSHSAYLAYMQSGGGGGLVAKSCPTLATPWTVACQAPLSMRFSRQEYWSGLPIRSPGDLPNPAIEPRSPTLQVDSLPPEPQEIGRAHV